MEKTGNKNETQVDFFFTGNSQLVCDGGRQANTRVQENPR